MLKTFFLMGVVLLSMNTIYAQEILLEKKIELRKPYKTNDGNNSLLYKSNDQITYFLNDKENIYSYFVDKDTYQLIDSCSITLPDKKLNILIGCNIDETGHHYFFSNERKSKFLVKSILSSYGEEVKIPIKLKKEEFLETLYIKGKFFVFTLVNSSSIIKAYEFTGNQVSNTYTVDLSYYNFSKTEKKTLFDVLVEHADNYSKTLFNLQKIDINKLNSITDTSKKHKLYQNDKKIVITLDHENNETKLITIFPSDFSHKIEVCLNSNLSNSPYTKSNSYLLDDYLFQIVGNSSKLSVRVNDMKKKVLVNHFEVNEKEVITWKNSPLFQKGRNWQNALLTQNNIEPDTIKKTKQFLKKISASDLSLSVYKLDDNLGVTIGGVKEKITYDSHNDPVVKVSTPSNNPEFSYKYYYFNTIIDPQNCKHITENSSLEKLNDIIKLNSGKNIYYPSLFITEKGYLLSQYNKKDKLFYIKSFKNEPIDQ
ncbi:hypothetical protein [Flammeovirga sp. OC4]|uniref:hypothetical protein n=1 Tax=Flammeovirga sp. OC4 TaxID=1382345 RepID=UPI0012E00771|nr:hypothetical protein [Flammeovirga sp. OC4]